ncbi:hypothetical protein [Pseudomonas sp. O230]|uniref:hypothetical protein n=1 Tax=Pseudomonas sp. O230 TaxID=3159450 RepID=UPI00387B28B0
MTHNRESVVSGWDQATLKLNGMQIQLSDKNLLFRGQENVLTVEFPSPIVSAARLGVGINEEGLNLEATPPFNRDVKDTFSWTIKPDEGRSGPVVLVLYSAEIQLPLMLSCSVIASDLDSELRVLLGGVAIPPGGATYSGEGTQTLTLDYLNGELLKNVPLALDAVLETGFLPGEITGEPALRELTTPHEWEVTWPGKDGTFKLKLFSEQEKAVLLTPIVRVEQALESVSFNFVELVGDAPLPIPPEEYLYPANYFSRPCALILKDSEGSPLQGISITISQPDNPDWIKTTDQRGKVPYFIANSENSVGHTFKVLAMAELPKGQGLAELWVKIVPAQNT